MMKGGELIGVVRRNAFYDSVRLMLVSEQLRALPGVEQASAVMATALNLALLADAGLLTDEAQAGGAGDLVVAVRAASPAAARAALARAEALLAAPRADVAGGAEVASRSVSGAARRTDGATLAVISVPGPYAAAEAHQALSAGLSVFLFSDNVSIEDEIALKRRGRARGLLVMGPECGTSLIDGIGLGFANRVRRGEIGLVAASGTGLQEVTTLIHHLGGGVSHAVGTGGRDLEAAVGGLTTLMALERLGRDAATRAIAIVSKSPSPTVARQVLAAAAATGKPVIACLFGWTGAPPAGVRMVVTLEETAHRAVEAVGLTPRPLTTPRPPVDGRPGRGIRGFFTGGSLCAEAEAITGGADHRFVDFGAEQYTRGRPHPMIDPGLRNAAVAEAGADPAVGAILVDVVLGYGAHPDPAGALAPAIADARGRAARAGRGLHVVAHVVGTEGDPQHLSAQEATLQQAGALVCPSNRLAAGLAKEIVGGR